MSIEKERELFELWCIKDDEFCIHRYAGSDDYSDDYTQCAWMAWQASANRQGYKLVPVNDINIADMIWGKCSCGSSRSPIVSDREGYNLIHCFACGANKYIHEDY